MSEKRDLATADAKPAPAVQDAVTAIRRGLEDVRAGRTRPLAEALDQIRRDLDDVARG